MDEFAPARTGDQEFTLGDVPIAIGGDTTPSGHHDVSTSSWIPEDLVIRFGAT